MNYEIALKIATDAHKGQKRWNGDEYITHPISVADTFGNEKLKIVGILHDVLEDTDVTLVDLKIIHKFSQPICTAVDVLTHYTKDSYAQYITIIKYNTIARVIKIADLQDNLRDLEKGQRKDKYELALLYLKE